MVNSLSGTMTTRRKPRASMSASTLKIGDTIDISYATSARMAGGLSTPNHRGDPYVHDHTTQIVRVDPQYYLVKEEQPGETSSPTTLLGRKKSILVRLLHQHITKESPSPQLPCSTYQWWILTSMKNHQVHPPTSWYYQIWCARYWRCCRHA